MSTKSGSSFRIDPVSQQIIPMVEASSGEAKTSTTNRANPGSSSGLERYCRCLRSWMVGKDLPPSEELVACFRPFLAYLVGS